MKILNMVLVLLVVLSSFSLAADRSGFELNVFTGLATPSLSDELGNERTNGVIAGVGAWKQFSPRFSLGTKVQYTNLPLNRNGMYDSMGLLPETTLVEGDALSVLSISLQSRLSFPSKNSVVSYFFVAPKFNMLFQDDIWVSTTDSDIVIERQNDNLFSVETGIGLDIEIEKTRLFVETSVDYWLRSSENSIIVPVRVGVIIPL